VGEEWVYVIGSPGMNIVKIGWTTNLSQRIAAIRTMSPVPLDVLWSTPACDGMEYGLHGYFAEIRSHGEWFRFEDEDPVDAVRRAVESGAWRPIAARRTPSAPKRDRTEELARRKEALDEIGKLSAEFLEAQEELDKARESLHEAIASILDEQTVRPGEIAEHTPYDRNHVGRIGRAAGVTPLREATVRSAR
jgi:hypothetical protein